MVDTLQEIHEPQTSRLPQVAVEVVPSAIPEVRSVRKWLEDKDPQKPDDVLEVTHNLERQGAKGRNCIGTYRNGWNPVLVDEDWATLRDPGEKRDNWIAIHYLKAVLPFAIE